MGRTSHARALSIWANGLRVGSWRLPGRGEMELHYDSGWKNAREGRPLSLSLPFGLGDVPLKGAKVQSYFENLLPDSQNIRERLALRFRTRSDSAFDLLEAIGRDCVGAVQLLAEDAAPESVEHIAATPLSEQEVAAHLQRMVARPVAGVGEDDDFRISLAGAQEKTALLWHQGAWHHPHGATPTTHILKLPIGLVGHMRADFRTSVENEWLCMRLLHAYGLPTAQVAMLRFVDQPVLAVQRFDRQWAPSGTWIQRLPQEDFCQALGVPPHQKYESDGGPGVRDLARLLQFSEHARDDLAVLLKSQILFWMLAATDGHAKNFSLRLLPGGRYRLTPLYDVMSAWPVLGDGPAQWPWHKARLAMAVTGANRHYKLKEIQRRHFNAMAQQCGWGDSAEPLITELLERTPGAIDAVRAELPAHFPAPVAEAILGGVGRAAQQLARMPSA